MKLTIHENWQWLGVEYIGIQVLFTDKPFFVEGCWHKEKGCEHSLFRWHNPDIFAGLTPGSLYKRDGEDWKEVTK